MKIMVCYDSSKEAQKALESAFVQAKYIKPVTYIATSVGKGKEDDLEYIRKIQRDLETAQKRFKESGLPCESHVLYHAQTPGEDLVEFANRNEIDEIIIGVKKISKVGKLLFGSTAQHVILEAKCPVLTVK